MILYTQLVGLYLQLTAPSNSTDLISAPNSTNQTAQTVNSTYFMSIHGYPSEQLVFEAKAYCAAFGHLSDQFLTEEEKMTTENITDTLSVGNSTQKGGENGTTTGQDDPRSLWENYEFNPNQTARTNLTKVSEGKYQRTEHVYNMNAILQLRTLSKRMPRPVRSPEMFQIHEKLRKRVADLKNSTHQVEFPALEGLFFNQTLTDQLFTNEIDQHIKDLNPSIRVKDILLASLFDVVSCEEHPNRGQPSIVFALKGTVPVIPKEMEREYLEEVTKQE